MATFLEVMISNRVGIKPKAAGAENNGDTVNVLEEADSDFKALRHRAYAATEKGDGTMLASWCGAPMVLEKDGSIRTLGKDERLKPEHNCVGLSLAKNSETHWFTRRRV